MPLLLPLVDLTAFVIALGLCVIAIYFVRALFGTAGSAVGWIPWVGSKIKGELKAIEQKLTSELGNVVAGLDHAIALTWYRLASLVEKIGHEIMANAGALASIAAIVAGLPGYGEWRALILKLKSGLVWAEQRAVGVAHSAANAVSAAVARFERWTRSQVTALRHSIAVTIPNSIAGLRKRTRVLERAAERDWKLLRKHERLLGIGALTGVVAVVLSRLGLSWARCTNVGKVGRGICRTDQSLIDSLLTDTLLIVGTVSFVEFLEGMGEIMPEALDAVDGFVRV